MGIQNLYLLPILDYPQIRNSFIFKNNAYVGLIPQKVGS